MSFPTINPTHAYAVAAGTYAAGNIINQVDILLHIIASLVVIGSGLIVFFRKK